MSLLDTASLLLTPNAYKEGKLYSVIPSDGSGDFTFTRATTATRVNSEGLVELVPYNLVTYSEQFDNAAWSKINASVTANAATSPDGALTADKMVSISANTGSKRFEQTFIAVSGTTYTVSAYFKADGWNFAFFNAPEAQFTTRGDLFLNLTNGTLSGSTSLGSVESVGNGWYRLKYTRIATASGSTSFRFGFSDTASISSTGDGTNGVLIWGAQFVEGTNALPYQKTETRLNIPRLDYSLGGCPNILLEPQRTNLALQSSSFDSASWIKTSSSVTANSTTSPSGIVDADTFAADGTSSIHLVQTNSISFVSGTTYTSAIYAKKNTNNFLQIISAFSAGGQFANFDLNLGVVGSLGTVSGSNPTASITSVGDGWYRCAMTFTPTATTSQVHSYAIVSSATSARAESNALNTSVFLWGAQLEAGSYATSYIPTTTASVTRNQDIASKTGISALIGQTEGTLFLDFVKNNNDLGVIQISDGTTSNRIYIGINNTNIIAQVRSGGGAAQAAFTVAATNNTRYKCAIAYKANDFVLYINGNQEGIDTSGLVPVSFSQFQTSDIVGTIFVNPINSTALWKERLTNDQLAQLTTI